MDPERRSLTGANHSSNAARSGSPLFRSVNENSLWRNPASHPWRLDLVSFRPLEARKTKPKNGAFDAEWRKAAQPHSCGTAVLYSRKKGLSPPIWKNFSRSRATRVSASLAGNTAHDGVIDAWIVSERVESSRPCNSRPSDPGVDEPSFMDAGVALRECLRGEQEHLRVRVAPGVGGKSGLHFAAVSKRFLGGPSAVGRDLRQKTTGA